MNDRIITSYLTAFANDFGLTHLPESDSFERFVNYCVVSKHHADVFEPDDVAVGGSGDLGLDGVAILVNDHIVVDRESVDHLKQTRRRLDVQFIFIQSKTAPHFDTAEIGAVFTGVRHFFGDTLPPDTNQRVQALHSVKEYVFDSSIDMDRNPTCRVYYVTTGSWKPEQNRQASIDQSLTDLRRTGLFDEVFFHPIDGEALKKLYRELNNKIIREIPFEKHSILPEITGVEEAYIGVIPCREYLALISDDDGNLNRRLFYDNVRDFQGHNPVNKEIESTIHEDTQKDRFALLNNGVTVVAREAKKTGARFKLVDFQVVNGCQTSHILFLNRDRLTESVYMPIKLIVTKDNEVINQVIQGTNRQTEVKLEAFESLKPFQKRLEEYYLAVGKGPSSELYYERRSKQYDNRGLRRDQIVSLATQVKCFVAMFLNEPHSTHRYYGELLRSYQTRVFSESHSVAPYFVSGLAYAVLEKLFSDGVLPRRSRASRFQLLMLYRLLNEPREMPPLNSKQVDKYCDELAKGLAEVSKAKECFSAALALLDGVRQRFSKSREPAERTRAFTTALVEEADGSNAGPGGISTMTGTVKWFSGVKWFGYITGDDGKDVRVRSSNILSETYGFLEKGQRVRFAVKEFPRGEEAVDVELVEE